MGEIRRIYNLLDCKCIRDSIILITPIEFADTYCFLEWKNRHSYLNIEDMADDLDIELDEGMKSNIKSLNSKLDDDIGFMLNNIYIRHNNKSGKSKKDYVSKMRKDTMEKWYDETYQMLLLAFLLN